MKRLLKRLPRKSKKTESAPAVEAKPLSEAPEDFRNKFGAVKGAALVVELLGRGLFTGSYGANLKAADEFMRAMMTRAEEELRADPRFSEYFPNA